MTEEKKWKLASNFWKYQLADFWNALQRTCYTLASWWSTCHGFDERNDKLIESTENGALRHSNNNNTRFIDRRRRVRHELNTENNTGLPRTNYINNVVELYLFRRSIITIQMTIQHPLMLTPITMPIKRSLFISPIENRWINE